MLRFIVLLCGLLAGAASAAPREIQVVYHATRNGQPFATVTETFRQQGGRYQIESVTEGVGVYALFGTRRLTSEGEVTEAGLRPLRFEQQQGDDARRRIVAEFDWAATTLTMRNKGRVRTDTLKPGTQDILSYAYQFMFAPPDGERLVMPVTTGKRLRAYQYQVAGREVPVSSTAGQFATVHLVEASEDEDSKELWLAPTRHYLPVRIIVNDADTGKIEQTLTSLHAK